MATERDREKAVRLLGGENHGTLGFLRGGGEMGALMRAHDWSSSSLGPPSGWPQPLRTVVRLMLNTGHPMYVWWGAEGACLYNDAYRQSIGPERHPGSLGQPARAVWDEIWGVIGPQIEHVRSGGGATWHEDHLVPITRNGRREDVYWTYSYSPIDDEATDSGIGGVLVVCTETTQKVLAERRLEGEISRQRRLFQCAPGFIAVLAGREHAFEFVNDAYVRLLGDRDFLHRPLRDVVPEAEGQGYLELLDRVFATGKRFIAEESQIWLTRTPQGGPEKRFLDFIYEPVIDAAGQVTGIFVEGFDVTDRANAHAALREREAQLRELNADLERQVMERTGVGGRFWQISPDLLGVLRPDGRFERANPAWQAVLGWSESEVCETSVFEFLHPGDRERTRGSFERLKRGHPIPRIESRCRRKDGGYTWLAWSAAPFGDAYYCSGRDVTAEKGAQAELAAAQATLRQAQKMEAVGQLTGGIAHDFNNLLMGISGSLELLQARVAQGQLAEAGRHLAAAQGAVTRAATLTQRLLAFSRQQALDPKPVNLNRLAAGMEELIRRAVGPGVHVEVAGADGLWPVLADPSQLENALLNLCVNARDAMPGGGRLTIRTANTRLDGKAALERDLPAGRYVSLCVADTGTGMPAAVASRAFDPFFTTKPLGQGTGLGLSMVHGFARQSGGQVSVESEVGLGTTMSLHFPCHDEPATEAVAPAAEGAAAPAGLGEVVLVVDDEPTVRMLIVDVLEGAGYAVVEAVDGPSALRVLQSSARIDLLVTDVGLPGGMNGRQVAERARAQRPGLKVLFITGYAESALTGDGQLAPGMQVLAKPFALDALGRKIREMLKP